jgi:hypothetical protein
MMLNFSKFLHSESGKYILSIILGIGLASLFRASCKGKKCLVYHAPPLDEIDDKTYKFGDKCYKFVSKSEKCDTNKQIVEFE